MRTAVRRGVIRSSAKLANARGERREQGCARPSMSHCATCEGMPARLSKSAQRHFTDCLAALGQCVGLLQVFDADRAEPTRPWTRTLVDYLRPGAGASLPRGCFASALIRFHRRPRCAARRRRTATRGHSATEGGDERVGVKRALSVRAPASRTDSMGKLYRFAAVSHHNARGERRDQGPARAALPEGTGCAFRVQPPPPPGNDAPLIGERAAARGRSAREGGDVKAGSQASILCSRTSSRTVGSAAYAPRRNVRGERRDQRRARSSMTYDLGDWMSVRAQPPRSPATMRAYRRTRRKGRARRNGRWR